MAIKRRPPANCYSVAEARDQFARVVHEAENGRTVEVTRRGRTVAMLISAQAYDTLRAGGRSFAKALLKFRSETRLSRDGIDAAFLAGLRDRSPGRER